MNSVLGDRRTILILLGPALLVYTAVMLIPSLVSLGYTAFDGNPIAGFQFVGFDNIGRLFQDPQVGQSLWFTVRFAIIVTLGQVVLGYAIALLYVFVLRRSSTVIRTLVFFPVVLPTVAVALLFQRLFAIVPNDGVVNSIVTSLGGDSVNWLGTPDGAFWVLVILEVWRAMGFYAVLVYAGLLDIPEEMIESARLDGASGFRLIRHIVLPLSLPVLISAIIFSINGTLKAFDAIYATTRGGPGTSTSPLTLYMFQTSFSFGDYGYGASLALLLTMLCLVVTVFIFRSSRRDVREG